MDSLFKIYGVGYQIREAGLNHSSQSFLAGGKMSFTVALLGFSLLMVMLLVRFWTLGQGSLRNVYRATHHG
jgi:hypothetical protein